MAGREREVRVTVLGDSKGAQKALADLNDHADKTEGRFGKMGGAIAGFGKAAALGLAGAGVAAGGFLAKAIAGASDLEETLSKVGVVFGETKDQVVADAEFMAKKFGIPKQQFLDASASIGLIGKASGVAKGEVGTFSTNMARLATDASSFYNVPLEEALAAIQSGLTGEAEPMRRFGVLLNENAVKEEAYALGIAKRGAELTDAQKVQARASLITKGMSDASGDLERTQGSLANRVRELKGRFENFATSVGSAVLPLVLKVFDAFEKIGSSSLLREAAGGIRAFAAAFKAGDGDVTSDGFAGAMERMANSAREVWDKVREAWPQIKSTIMGVVDAVVGFVKDNWPEISKTIRDYMNTIRTVIAGVIDVVRTIWRNFGDQIKDYTQTAFRAAMDIIQGALQIIRGIVQTVTSLIKGDWSGVWEGIKQILAGVLDVIMGLVDQAINFIKTTTSVGLEIVKGIFSGAWDAVFELTRNAVAHVVDVFLGMVETIINGAAAAFGWIPGLGGKLREAADKFAEFRDDVNAALRGIQDRTVYVTVVTQGGDQRTYGGEVGGRFSPGIQLAKGGIVDGPTMALIGEAGRELVLPLTDMGRTSELLAQAGLLAPFGSPSGAPAGAGGGVTITVTVGTLVGSGGMQEFAEIIKAELLRKQRRVPSLGFS